MTDREPREIRDDDDPRDERDVRQPGDPRDIRDPRERGDPVDASDRLDDRIIAIRSERIFPRWMVIAGFVIVTVLLVVLLLRVQLVIDDLRGDIEDNMPTTTILFQE